MADQVVELTPLALERVLAARAEEGLGTGHGLRLAVRKGGCSGYEYSVKFTAEPAEGDIVFETGGLSVYVDRESEKLLRGTVLDYEDGLHGAGLRFVNPNAGYDCGCGASFSATENAGQPAAQNAAPAAAQGAAQAAAQDAAQAAAQDAAQAAAKV